MISNSKCFVILLCSLMFIACVPEHKHEKLLNPVNTGAGSSMSVSDLNPKDFKWKGQSNNSPGGIVGNGGRVININGQLINQDLIERDLKFLQPDYYLNTFNGLSIDQWKKQDSQYDTNQVDLDKILPGVKERVLEILDFVKKRNPLLSNIDFLSDDYEFYLTNNFTGQAKVNGNDNNPLFLNTLVSNFSNNQNIDFSKSEQVAYSFLVRYFGQDNDLVERKFIELSPKLVKTLSDARASGAKENIDRAINLVAQIILHERMHFLPSVLMDPLSDVIISNFFRGLDTLFQLHEKQSEYFNQYESIINRASDLKTENSRVLFNSIPGKLYSLDFVKSDSLSEEDLNTLKEYENVSDLISGTKLSSDRYHSRDLGYGLSWDMLENQKLDQTNCDECDFPIGLTTLNVLDERSRVNDNIDKFYGFFRFLNKKGGGLINLSIRLGDDWEFASNKMNNIAVKENKSYNDILLESIKERIISFLNIAEKVGSFNGNYVSASSVLNLEMVLPYDLSKLGSVYPMPIVNNNIFFDSHVNLNPISIYKQIEEYDDEEIIKRKTELNTSECVNNFYKNIKFGRYVYDREVIVLSENNNKLLTYKWPWLVEGLCGGQNNIIYDSRIDEITGDNNIVIKSNINLDLQRTSNNYIFNSNIKSSFRKIKGDNKIFNSLIDIPIRGSNNFINRSSIYSSSTKNLEYNQDDSRMYVVNSYYYIGDNNSLNNSFILNPQSKILYQPESSFLESKLSRFSYNTTMPRHASSPDYQSTLLGTKSLLSTLNGVYIKDRSVIENTKFDTNNYTNFHDDLKNPPDLFVVRIETKYLLNGKNYVAEIPFGLVKNMGSDQGCFMWETISYISEEEDLLKNVHEAVEAFLRERPKCILTSFESMGLDFDKDLYFLNDETNLVK